MDDLLNLSNYAIIVTSFEINDGKTTAVLSHVFHGETLDQALGYAKSHMVSDLFYSASFIGEMKWKDKKLILSYDTKVISISYMRTEILQRMTDDAHVKLEAEVKKVLDNQYKWGFPEIINAISKEK